MHTATYLYNRRPNCPLQLLTPYETIFLQPPDYSHLRAFECLCYPNLLATTPNKLSPRSTACIFLGYPTEHKGYKCMDLSTRKVITSCHVLFNEHMFPLTLQPSVTKPQPSLPARDPGESALDLVPIRVCAREIASTSGSHRR
jgi:hypothetical protein